MQRNITIRVSMEAASWARRKAAEENTSVSKLVGRMLEAQIRQADSYRDAYERFKTYSPSSKVSASARMGREASQERR